MKKTLFYFALFSLVAAFNNRGQDLSVNQIARAIESKDVNQVIRVLPTIDRLWSVNQKDYFSSVKSAAQVFSTATNVNERARILVLFSNALEKPLPTEPKLAIECLEGRYDLILYFLNFGEVRDAKAEWLKIAKYIGQIRERTNPNYVRKSVSRNFINPGETLSEDQIKQRRQENENNQADNRLQSLLEQTNSMLTFQLVNNVKRLQASDVNHGDFIKSITTAAHLSKDEQRQIKIGAD